MSMKLCDVSIEIYDCSVWGWLGSGALIEFYRGLYSRARAVRGVWLGQILRVNSNIDSFVTPAWVSSHL